MDNRDALALSIRRREGYCDLKMWEAAWEELEALPSELKQDLTVLTWRMQIQMGMGEHRKASYIGLSLVQQFPIRLGVLLLTAGCLIHCQDYQAASRLLRTGLSALPDHPDLWLTLAKVEALLGENDAAKDCVRQYVALNPEAKADIFTLPELNGIW